MVYHGLERSTMVLGRSTMVLEAKGRLECVIMTLHCIGGRMGENKPMCLVQPPIGTFAMVLQCTSQWLPTGMC